jgi:hypothetical protein
MAFFTDYLEMFDSFEELFVDRWEGLPVQTRIFVALTVAIGLLYVGSKSEQAGWSTIFMLSSLGFFAYLLMLGYALVH